MKYGPVGKQLSRRRDWEMDWVRVCGEDEGQIEMMSRSKF